VTTHKTQNGQYFKNEVTWTWGRPTYISTWAFLEL